MADVNSTYISNRIADPVVMNSVHIGGRLRVKRQQIESAVAHAANDVYRFFTVRSSDVIWKLELSCDAITSMVDTNWGLHTEDGGAAVDDNLFDDAQTLAVALVNQEKRWGADSALNLDTMGDAVWQLLGLTEDPHLTYDVTMTTISDPAHVGTIDLSMTYTAGD